MSSVHNLQSFVAERERKLELKVEAAMKHPTNRKADKFKSNSSQYQSTLDRKFAPKKGSKVWPMRYEITPHEE